MRLPVPSRLNQLRRRGAFEVAFYMVALIGVATSVVGVSLAEEIRSETHADYANELAEFEQLRRSLAERRAQADGEIAQAQVRDDAEEALASFLSDSVFPAWAGTQWAMGGRADATRPHQAGRAVSCSGFVAAALSDAGVRISDRLAFRRASAIDIQRSLLGTEEVVHRFVGLSSDRLSEKMIALGNGIYLIGLRNHVGFVHVGKGRATLVHAGSSGTASVQHEPLADALPVRVSHPSGFWVTPLTGSKHLIEAWLEGRAHRLVRHGLP